MADQIKINLSTPAPTISVNISGRGQKGSDGTDGADGEGVIAGGTEGQVLAKLSDDDYDTTWKTVDGTGTVTSVAVSGSDGIEVDSGSPITAAGTIALGLNKTTTLAFLNVEDGADVTDTTNVTAAGALMDSEVTNLADVKSFDPTDYATAAQGTTADSAVQPGDDADTLGSGVATDGQVLTADGLGGAAWEDATGGGGSMTSFTLTGDSGTPQTISDGNTLDVAGGTGISTVAGATDTVTINVDASQTQVTALGTISTGTWEATDVAVAHGGTGASTAGGARTNLGLVIGTDVVGFGGALGTPTSGTLTNCTGLPISTGVSGLGTNVATFLATPSSANLASAVTETTGSGALVFTNTPSFTTPILGTPTSGTLTNCTGLPVAGITDSTTSALGVGSLEIGHATDTTLARVSAGVASIEGVNVMLASGATSLVELGFAASDETTPLSADTGVLTFAMPFSMTLTRVYASLNVGPTTTAVQVDINDAGTSLLNSVLNFITTGPVTTFQTTSFAGAASSYALSLGDVVTVDIDQGDVAAAGLKITLAGYRT